MKADDDKPSFLSRWSQRKAQARTVTPLEPAVEQPPSPLPAAATEAPGKAGAGAGHAPGIAPGGMQAVQARSSVEVAEAPSVASLADGASVEAANRSPAVGADGSSAAGGRGAAPKSLPTMDDVALLNRQSDYSRFVARGVDARVRNAAMKKLFADPHFNVMDGLDIYIGDYSQPDPIPPEMLRMMTQSKTLGLFDHEETPQDDAALARAPSPEVPAAEVAGADEVVGPEGSPAVAGSTGAEAGPGSAPAADAAGATDNPAHDDHTDLQLQSDDAARRPGADPGARTGEV